MNPGDYVTINMGINVGDEADYAILLENYYVNAVLQRGGNPVILTATPQGPVRDGVGNYNEETGEFNCDRGDGARNAVLRSIAAKYDLPLIELGNWGDDYFNSLTDEDVQNEALWGPYRWNESRDTATTGDTPITSKLELVSSWYGDHNHYTSPFAETVASYILGELEDMVLNAPVLTVTVGEITLNGNTATVPVTVENGSAPINAYVAQYADGTLVSIDAVSNAEVTGTQNIEIPFEVADGADTIKVMVWDNAQQQYCDVFSDSIEYPEA